MDELERFSTLAKGMGRFFTLLIFTAFVEKCFKSFFAPALVTMDQVKLVPSRGLLLKRLSWTTLRKLVSQADVQAQGKLWSWPE